METENTFILAAKTVEEKTFYTFARNNWDENNLKLYNNIESIAKLLASEYFIASYAKFDNVFITKLNNPNFRAFTKEEFLTLEEKLNFYEGVKEKLITLEMEH